VLIPEPEKLPQPDSTEAEQATANERPTPRVLPRRRDGRSLPPT